MNISGRNIDEYGNVTFNVEGLVDMIMSGHDISGVMVDADDKTLAYNALCKVFDHPEDSLEIYEKPTIPVAEWDKKHQEHWFIPEPFASIDVLQWLISRCSNEEEQVRVLEEYLLFQQRDMDNVLRFLIYMIDHFRQNKILWGVGRGSSVSSFALYLIGVHRIHSIKYGLDYREFLK